MSNRPQPCGLRIVKVGGSLLDWPQLAEQLSRWLESQPRQPSVLICGGGDFTDAVRRAQAIHRFDDETAHWMCVRALSVTAQLLARLLPGAKLAGSLDDVVALARGGAEQIVFDAGAFLRAEEPQVVGLPLPHDWTATTDSIAARIAELTGASELILLKSSDPPPHRSLADLAVAGYVDEHFPLAAAELPAIRLVNVRRE
ncbi:MAG TPA: hypothetical protein VFV87_06205 [Pirellulaceae bacterium]|nr:hypothetical protein [Pirellulaceae bacterium]